jgi:hypothetical protein
VSYADGISIQMRTARKAHYCSQEWAHDQLIKPGDRYGAATIFKSSDAHCYATRAPIHRKLCLQCVSPQHLET